jgi:hypothetical protein
MAISVSSPGNAARSWYRFWYRISRIGAETGENGVSRYCACGLSSHGARHPFPGNGVGGWASV